LRELAFLNSGWKSPSPTNAERGEAETFYYKDGVEEFVKQLNKSKEADSSEADFLPQGNQADQLDDKEIEIHVEVVLQYNDSYNDQVLCYTNTIHNPDGGTHLSGFRSALTRAINQYARRTSC
jgi:DNA gyrase subunit B